MEKRWLVKNDNPDLIVFALGWACEPQAIAHIRPSGYDILCLYDYRAPSALSSHEFEAYRAVYLFAWSFGVTMAERLLASVPFRKAIALNGTPYPVDDRFGIPIRPFRLTLRSIRSAGTDAFERRTYGAFYPQAASWTPSRDIEAKTEELETLYHLSVSSPRPPFCWHTALIGGQDLIFPPENQHACWQELSPQTRIVYAPDSPHYPFADPQRIMELMAE